MFVVVLFSCNALIKKKLINHRIHSPIEWRMEASQSQSDEKFFELKIDSSSVRIFSAALHLCQKVGRDVILGNCNSDERIGRV